MEASLAGQPRPGTLKVWIDTCRPRTLAAGAVPVIVGTACAAASGGLRVLPALAAFVGALLIQVGTNLANDVFDAEKGADTPDRVGPTRAVATGLLSAAQVRRAMWLTFALAALVGVYLVVVGGVPIIIIGIASIISGIAYTGGLFPLGYNGLGDLFVLIFFGFVAVCGTTLVQVGSVPTVSWLASVPVGLLSTAIIVVNNLRDRHTDAKVGKRTLAVRLGRTATLVEYGMLVVGAHLFIPVLAWWQRSYWPLLAVLSLPLGISLIRQVARTEGRALNPLLGATARLLLIQGLLLSVGLVL